MNLYAKLLEREAAGRPVKVGVIGAGKFGTMFLAQARLTRGLHVAAVADLDVARAKDQLKTANWPDEAYAASSLADAHKKRTTFVIDDAEALIADPQIEVIVEATGVPGAGIRHALKAIASGKHIVMVNVEADAVAGPLLARRAKAAGVVYSLAWGDQPALICEHVDWARAAGFKVVCAGKGTRYEPHYHKSNPDNVWDILDKYLSISDRKSINPKMFNSFVDGTKSGIEMTAVCNATGLVPQSNGLGFPPATRFELAEICKPENAGGTLEKAGVTEVTSSVYRDGRDVPHHLALGTYVVFEGDTEYARRCFKEYAMLPDKTGKYAALYRPIHMIGLELGISVASAALRNEPTGAPTGFRSDVVATAKRALKAGEMLDGEGGFCVWGKQTPADVSLERELLPLGLAHNVKLTRGIAEGEALRWSDVAYDPNDPAVKVRREMEAAFGRRNVGAESVLWVSTTRKRWEDGMKIRHLSAGLFAAVFALSGFARADDTNITVIVFPGVQNLPMFAAQAKGFYAKRGLKVDLKFTPNSDELRNGLAEGRYQIAHSAVDNAFALKDKANVDIAVVSGGDNSFNHLYVQPEIKSLADIKGKTVAVDAVNTAYAFQLYEMLRQHGLNKGDYEVKSVGGTTARLDALTKDKTIVAAMLNPPFSVRAEKAGLKDMGTAAAALGTYQGTGVYVLRPWGKANADTLVKYLEAYVEGLRWSFNPKNKVEAVGLLAERLKLPDDIATLSYDATKNEFNRDGAIDMDGMKNVLKLRAQFEGGTPASPEKYLDLSYYEKALAGL